MPIRRSASKIYYNSSQVGFSLNEYVMPVRRSFVNISSQFAESILKVPICNTNSQVPHQIYDTSSQVCMEYLFYFNGIWPLFMCYSLSLLTFLTPLTPTKFREQCHYMGSQKGFDHRIGHLFSRTAQNLRSSIPPRVETSKRPHHPLPSHKQKRRMEQESSCGHSHPIYTTRQRGSPSTLGSPQTR